MRPDAGPGRPPSVETRLERVEKRLRRERLARREVEEIAERSTRALYDKQQELVLLEAVVLASNESATVEGTLQGAVDAVCAHTGWPVGHAYLRGPSGELEPSAIWHIEQTSQFAAFRRVTEQTAFSEAIGLPGRVLATGRAAWITDVNVDSTFRRRNLGLRGAFAFPMRVRGGRVEYVALEADPPFGVARGGEYRVQQLPLEPGDRLMFLTDGMTERNASTVDIERLICAGAEMHPREAVQHLVHALPEATAGAPQDDATVMCLDWHGGPPRKRLTDSGAND